MSSSLRRGALAAAAIAFSIASLAACGAGSDAQTLEVRPDNAATAVGDVKIQNAMVITQPELDAEGPAVVSATLFNNSLRAQTLDSVTLPGTGAAADLKPAKGSGKVTIPAGGHVVLGGKGNASAVLPSGREAVQAGNVQNVTFTFSRTGAVKLTAFVIPAKSYFSKWGPSELPKSPSETPSKSATPSGSETASGSPAGSPSGSPTGSTATGSTNTGSAPDGTPTDASSASATANTGN